MAGCLDVLEKDSEDLTPEEVEIIRDAAQSIASMERSGRAPRYITELPVLLAEAAEAESRDNPNEIAIQRLRNRLPAFVLFTDEHRYLESEYNLAEVAGAPPTALRNLAGLGSLDLPRLLQAVENGDQADVNTLQTKANDKLDETFYSAWSQSGVRVQFRVDGTALHIQIRDEDNRFSGFDERSDGLREFVALLAFCTAQSIRDPVLLIDEAESHLHYDAQADLIDTLARQRIARKVVYTTHSVGCLPEDMGAGIRMVQPIESQRTRSRVLDRFWSENEPGLTRLLFGMGAATLAFLPIRGALFVEGPSDLILFPLVYRELTQDDHLGFQVVQGLSVASKQQIPILESHGSRVLYLVDNDKGGKNLEKWLTKRRVESQRIIKLAPPNSGLISIEDAIDSRIFVEAVNRYMGKWLPSNPVFRLRDLPTSNRSGWLDRLDPRHGRTVSKADIAYEIVDLLVDDPSRKVVENRRAETLRRLVESIKTKLGLDLEAESATT